MNKNNPGLQFNNKLYIYALLSGTPNYEVLGEIQGDNSLETIYGIWYKDIAFAVSKAPDYSLNNLSKDTIIKLLVRHQQVLESLRRNFSLIPVKLGTVLNNPEEVTKVLVSNEEKFKNLIATLKNKVELNLIVTWNNLQEVLNEISEEDEIKKIKQSFLVKEQVSQEDLIKVGEMVNAYLRLKKQTIKEHIISELRSLLEDYFVNEVVHNENAILNISLLISVSKVKDIDNKIDQLNWFYKEKLDFKITKMLLPQGFSTIGIKKVTREQLLAAKDVLELPGEAILEDIITSRRALLHHYHPDKNDAAVLSKVQEINLSYKLLEEYCKHNSLSFQSDKLADYYSINVLKAEKNDMY